jgi:hypothetical protein
MATNMTNADTVAPIVHRLYRRLATGTDTKRLQPACAGDVTRVIEHWPAKAAEDRRTPGRSALTNDIIQNNGRSFSPHSSFLLSHEPLR